MKLFFQRDCSCDEHDNLAEHRMEQIEPFIAKLEECLGVEVETGFLTDLQGDEGYMEALRNLLDNMHELDSFFGGVFSSRYRSPVVNVCGECGFSHSKGAVYSRNTDELVFECRNSDCDNWFAASGLGEEIGVYYLVDPVRDPSRNVAVHVFGGDYRDAEKGQKTSKLEKVAKITELANGETPEYFIAPMISDEEGKPLSKSKGTGMTVSEIGDPESFAVDLMSKVEEWMDEGREHVSQEEIV
jgi:lysyl-tRNA synthetase class I